MPAKPSRPRPTARTSTSPRSIPSSTQSERNSTMRTLLLCLLTAALMLSGCASSPAPLVPSTKPLLDSALAADCKPLGQPDKPDDYDAWLTWMVDVVLPNYGDCAIRHRRTIEAWPQ